MAEIKAPTPFVSYLVERVPEVRLDEPDKTAVLTAGDHYLPDFEGTSLACYVAWIEVQMTAPGSAPARIDLTVETATRLRDYLSGMLRRVEAHVPEGD